jgi:hypothetical protein
MSAPAFAWAFERGHELGLTSSQLLLLLYMADQSNCSGSFYTGQPRMVKYTRLSVRTVRDQIPQLEALGLIQVMATPGKPTLYHLLMQPVGEAATAAPANGAGRANGAATPATTAALPRQPLPVHPGNLRRQPRQNLHATPATTAGDPLVTQEEDPKKRASAQEGGGFKNSEPQGGTPPPTPPPPQAPVIGTTPGGSSYKPPTPQFASPDEARAVFQAFLAAKRQQAHPEPEPAADPLKAKRAAAATIFHLRKYAPAPGAKPERSRFEQIEALDKPATAADIIGEILTPIRRGPLDPVHTVAEQLAALGYPNMVEATA